MSRSAIFVCKQFVESRNTTRYQRLKRYSKEFDLTVFSFTTVPTDLQEECDVKQCPDSILFKLLFPLWVTYYTLMLKKRPRVVFTSFHKPALLTGLLLKALGYPWVADIFDDPTLGMQLKQAKMNNPDQSLTLFQWISYFYAYILLSIIKPSIKYADLCIFVPDVYRKYGLHQDDDNLLSITNGVDMDITQAEFPHQREKFTIYYVGHISKARGISEILDAAEIIRESYPDEVIFELVGPINQIENDWLNSEIEKRGLDGLISTVGRVPHQQALNRMTSADVCLCLLSSNVQNYDRTYPIKIFEYMAMGKPVVASNTYGIRNIIDHNQTGILVSNNNPQLVAEAIQKFIENPSFKQEIGDHAQSKVEEYTWEKINDQIISNVKQHCF